jgi:hypothetical protein
VGNPLLVRYSAGDIWGLGPQQEIGFSLGGWRMKRLLIVVAASALTVCLGAVPANAAGAFSQTVHMTTLHDSIPAGCTGPGSAVQDNATGNGVQHFTINAAGDFWFTFTFEGQDLLTEGLAGPPDAMGNSTFIDNGGPTFQGHMMEWFGFEGNNKNNVTHATFSFNGTNVAAPYQALSMHASFDVTVNANGVTTVNNFRATCS